MEQFECGYVRKQGYFSRVVNFVTIAKQYKELLPEKEAP